MTTLGAYLADLVGHGPFGRYLYYVIGACLMAPLYLLLLWIDRRWPPKAH
jgi:hypothetical protein